MKINETVEFLEGVLLNDQSQEFKDWYYKNIQILSENALPELDEYSRPIAYQVIFETFKITVYPKYIHDVSNNWASYMDNIKIEEV